MTHEEANKLIEKGVDLAVDPGGIDFSIAISLKRIADVMTIDLHKRYPDLTAPKTIDPAKELDRLAGLRKSVSSGP